MSGRAATSFVIQFVSMTPPSNKQQQQQQWWDSLGPPSHRSQTHCVRVSAAVLFSLLSSQLSLDVIETVSLKCELKIALRVCGAREGLWKVHIPAVPFLWLPATSPTPSTALKFRKWFHCTSGALRHVWWPDFFFIVFFFLIYIWIFSFSTWETTCKMTAALLRTNAPKRTQALGVSQVMAFSTKHVTLCVCKFKIP